MLLLLAGRHIMAPQKKKTVNNIKKEERKTKENH